jgi:hypothetical protein
MPDNNSVAMKKRAHSPSSTLFRSEAPDSPSSTSSPDARDRAIAAIQERARKRFALAPQVLEDRFEDSSSSVGSEIEQEVAAGSDASAWGEEQHEKILLCLNNAYDHFQNDWEVSNAYVWIPEFIFKSQEAVHGSRESTPVEQHQDSGCNDTVRGTSTTPTSQPGSTSPTTTSRPGSPEGLTKRISTAHKQYRKNCITPLIEWITKKYKLCWKGSANATKQREHVEEILRLVHMSYQSKNPETLWKPPEATLSACAFFNIWFHDETGGKFRPASDKHQRPEILADHVGLDFRAKPNKQQLKRLVPVSYIVSELKLRFPPDDIEPLSPNEKARIICLIKDPVLAAAFHELHGHFTHRSQYDDKSITCMDVIARRFNDTEVKCVTTYTALTTTDPEVCAELTKTVKDLDPNAGINVQSKEKLQAYLHSLKTVLTEFVRRWNKSGQNDPTQAPKYTTDDITLYAFYTLYAMNDEMCPLLYWGRDIPQRAQVELGVGMTKASHYTVQTKGDSEHTTIHLKLDESSTGSTSRESQLHETCQRLGATMNDLEEKIANKRIPAEHQARAANQYCQLSQNYLDHIEQLNAEVAKGLQGHLQNSQANSCN